MRKQVNKWAIRIAIPLGIILALFIIFHDNTDTEKIAKEQEESSLQKATEQLDILNNEDFIIDEDTLKVEPVN
jgi:uncharacterized protein YpmB